MLSRLVVRLLFKAVLSIATLLGVASYAHHLSGGDPGALWQRVAGGALDDLAASVDGLRDTAAAPLATLSGAGEGVPVRARSVWTWRDADGVVHYTGAPPTGIEASVLQIDPDVNVLAPLVPPLVPPVGEPSETRGTTPGAIVRSAGAPPATAFAAEADPLPGIGGALPGGREEGAGVDPGRAEALLRRLRPSSP